MPLVRFYPGGQHVKSQIPSMTKKRRVGRPRAFDKRAYNMVRPAVERFFGWIKNFKKLTVRYERRAKVFLGLIQLACIMILWRVLKQVPSFRENLLTIFILGVC